MDVGIALRHPQHLADIDVLVLLDFGFRVFYDSDFPVLMFLPSFFYYSHL